MNTYKTYKTIKKCIFNGCKNTFPADEHKFFCKEHRTEKQRQNHKQINILMVNNPLGHNKHTPKAELIGKREHPYRLMQPKELILEYSRLEREKYKVIGLLSGYSHKIAFIMELLGLKSKKEVLLKYLEEGRLEFEQKEGKIE